MTDSICVCTHPWIWHYAPNDVSVIRKRQAEGACAKCVCPAYQHHSGPAPKPRPRPSADTIARVLAPRPTYVRPVPVVVPARPVPVGRRNTYSGDREIPA